MVYDLVMTVLREAEIERIGRLTSLQKLVQRGSRTPPGLDSQIAVEATQLDEDGNPIVVVADGVVVGGETEGWIAVARLLLGTPDRVWKKVRRNWRRPRIIGDD